MNIQEALGAFLLQLEADGRSAHTVGQYRRHVRAFGDWLVEQRHDGDLRTVGPDQVARFFADDAARKRWDGLAKKAVSLNAMRTSLRCFFALLHQSGAIAANPARLLRRARCAPPPPRALHEDERAKLLAALTKATGHEEQRDAMLIELLLATGLRIGAAVALDAEDLDLEHGEIHVRRAKNDRPTTVLMPAAIVDKLRAFLAGRAAGPLFDAHGKRVSVRHMQRRFAAWLQRAGIVRRASLHSLRHTFATGVYRRTGDLQLTQRALGHASIVSTTIYATLEDARLRAAVGA